jgi:hypothetical protein
VRVVLKGTVVALPLLAVGLVGYEVMASPPAAHPIARATVSAPARGPGERHTWATPSATSSGAAAHSSRPGRSQGTASCARAESDSAAAATLAQYFQGVSSSAQVATAVSHLATTPGVSGYVVKIKDLPAAAKSAPTDVAAPLARLASNAEAILGAVRQHAAPALVSSDAAAIEQDNSAVRSACSGHAGA